MLELEQARYLNLVTFRKNGAEVRTPVWFATEGGRHYIFSNGEAGKVKRLRHTSRVRVAPCDVRGAVLGQWQEAQAYLLHDEQQVRRAHTALRHKYGWQMVLLDFFAGLFGRKRRRAYIAVVPNETGGAPL